MPGLYTPPFQLGGNPQGFLDRVGGAGGYTAFLQSLNPVPAPVGGGTINGQEINNASKHPSAPVKGSTPSTQGLSASPAPTAEASTATSQTQSQTQQQTPTQLPPVQIPASYLPGAMFGGSVQQHYEAYANWARTQGYSPLGFSEWKKFSNKFGAIQPGQASTPAGQQPTLPGSTPPPDPTQPGVNPNAPLRPDVNPFAFPDLLQQFQEAFGGLQLGNPQTTGIDPNFRGNIFNALAGGFANGTLGLPGQEADAVGGFVTNILANEVAKQQGRSTEREGLLRGLAEFLAQSQPAMLNQQNLGAAGALTAPGALDALDAQRRQDLDQSLAQAENTGANRLREAGIFGQGAAGATPLNALSANLANVRRRGLLDISEQRERDQLSRLAGATQATAVGTDITRALQQEPVLQLIASLGQAQNPAVGPFAGFLNQMLGLTAGQALANDSGSFFQQTAPLLGQGIGAVGSILAAPATGGASLAAGPLANKLIGQFVGSGP